MLYYAIFEMGEEGGFDVSFPDLQGAYTDGKNMHEALTMAKDLAAGRLINAEDDGEHLPDPTDFKQIDYPEGALLIPIELDLDFYRKKFDSKPVKKTLTIPNYLNNLGKKAGINFSQTLTEALEKKLGRWLSSEWQLVQIEIKTLESEIIFLQRFCILARYEKQKSLEMLISRLLLRSLLNIL